MVDKVANIMAANMPDHGSYSSNIGDFNKPDVIQHNKH